MTTIRTHTFPFILLAILMMAGNVMSSEDGPSKDIINNCGNEDFSPCVCHPVYSNVITCDSVPMEEVRQVFNRTTISRITQLDLVLPQKESIIPDDLVGKKAIGWINVTCASPILVVTVQPEAFRASAEFALTLSIENCDLEMLNFTFLDGFTSLETLYFQSTPSLQSVLATTLPALPSLKYLTINSCPDFGQLKDEQFPTLGHGLINFRASYNKWNDTTMSRVLGWILNSSSSSLDSLFLSDHELTKVPSELADFEIMDKLLLSNNSMAMSMGNGSLRFQVSPNYIGLDTSNIVEIQPGAFQGKYSYARIDMQRNNVTRMDENVFYPVLAQMTTPGVGYVNIDENPIGCDGDDVCHLAWLVRDHPEMLQDDHVYGRCSNGTFLKDLNPGALQDCP